MALQFDFSPDGGVQFSGSFQDLSFGKLLLWVAREKYTGELSITTAEIKQQWIFFKDGQPVGVRGGPSENYLGWLLVETGKINDATCMASLQEMAQQKKLQGQVLKAMGAINDVDLLNALRLQLQRKLIRVFTYRQGRFIFRSKPRIPVQDVPPGQLNLYPLIGHGIRQVNDISALRDMLKETDNQAFKLKEEVSFPATLEELPLDEDQLNALPFLYDWTDTDRFLQTGYLEQLAGLVLLSIFYVCEFFELGTKDQIRGKSRGASSHSPEMQAPPAWSAPPQPPAATPMSYPSSSNVPRYNPSSNSPSYSTTPTGSASSPPVAKPSAPRPATNYQQASTLRQEAASPTAQPTLQNPPPARTGSYSGDTSSSNPLPRTTARPAPAARPATPSTTSQPSRSVPSVGARPAPARPTPSATARPTNIAGTNTSSAKPASSGTSTAAPSAKPAAPTRPAAPARPTKPAAARPNPASSAKSPSSGNQPAQQQGTKIRPSKASEAEVIIEEEGLSPEDLELKHTIEAKLQQASEGANFYELLDVARTADTKEIRNSYRKLSRTFHPDRVAGSALEPLRKKLDSFFAQLNEAHQILTRKTTREDYDRKLQTPQKQIQHVENSVKAEEMYRMASVQIRRRDFKGALENLKWVCQISPEVGDYEADTHWCEYHLSEPKDWQSTVQKIEKTLEKEAEPERVYYYLGEIYREQKQNKEAIEAYEKYLQAAPPSPEADRIHQQLRILQHELKKQREAMVAERQKAKEPKKGGWGFGRK
ncbi:MAG: DnaJ domain-containing protein [Myxococcales bacterium]|nr:DnaJ domain-containing protein [Myxococcales bacterium]